MTTLTNFDFVDLVDDHSAADVNELHGGSLSTRYRNIETISATRQLLDADCPVQLFTASGANRDVKLAAETTTNHYYMIKNAGGSLNLVVKDDSGATTYATITPGDAWFFMSDGAAWSGVDLAALPTIPPAVTGPEAFGDNYVITPSISSNNLVLALKTIAGTDASSTNKIPFRIANTKRELTAALSVTLAAGTSIFNAGATEIATKDIDFFVYIGWRNADSTVFVLISRIPYANTYADFSATSTNEKYGAYSGSAPASTDSVECIGRFRAQNSGTASYNWSIPTALVINRPIFETDILTWVPTYTASGSMTYTSVTTDLAEYKIVGRILYFEHQAHGTTGGTASTTVYATVPFAARNFAIQIPMGSAYVTDTGASITSFAFIENTGSKIGYRRTDSTNWGLGSGRYVNGNGKVFI